jgi:putative DNA methylase
MTTATKARLIESDEFPFEFLSQLADRESWRKEIHRPIYHVHKWWAKRLGSVFRGILLGCQLPESAQLATEFYRSHTFTGLTVFDPFMGSGTTIGEAHKLGFTALGRDINPVAVEAVKTALGPLCRQQLRAAFAQLESDVAPKIRQLYRSLDKRGRPCDVLYYFWVMQAHCPDCSRTVDLFPSFVIARNAYPDRKPEIQIVCPNCGDFFAGVHGDTSVSCAACGHQFDPSVGAARGKHGHCNHCRSDFVILDAISRQKSPPAFRLYGKLVLTSDDRKEYLPASANDLAAYQQCSAELHCAVESGELVLPDLRLEFGHNTRQAMGYGFTTWQHFFNDRQLLALGWLRNAILKIEDLPTRHAMLTLFSGVLEFNNLFASYKGEGTGAVRHMFSHHILKPERTPIEANVWGTSKSSGSFSTLFSSRILRAAKYREHPTEVNGRSGEARTCSPAFTGQIETEWPTDGHFVPRGIYLSCGDSSLTGLPSRSLDLVVTDPPFFDNVHYSELADFFAAWQQIGNPASATTRHPSEVQDADADKFADKLKLVFHECHRVLRDEGLLVFTYHHSRREGWVSLATAILGSGFAVVNSHPVKAEMSVATPKSQAKEPIQFDIIVVCRKQETISQTSIPTEENAIASAKRKIQRLLAEGFTLSRNDRRIVLFGQKLTLLRTVEDIGAMTLDGDIDINVEPTTPSKTFRRRRSPQKLLFEDL